MSKVTLGYWGIRGRGQLPRLLLAYTGADWTDVQYTAHEKWFADDKQKLGLDFPNLPYLIDGDVKITESTAICNYIIESSSKTELLGKNVKERAVVLNLVGVINDIRDKVIAIIFSPEGAALLEKTWKETVSPKLENLAKFKGNKPWLYNYLTIADFILAEVSHYIENVYKEHYQTLTFLHEIRHNFESLPEIKAYYEKETAVKGPFVPPFATIKF